VTALIAALGGVRASVFAAAALAGWIIVGLFYVQHARQEASHANYRTEVAIEGQKAATALAEAIEGAMQAERAHRQRVAEIDAAYQKEIDDAKANADRTIADLRSGALVLRKRLAATGCPARGDGAPASGGNDPQETGLREEDVRFLVLESQRADQHTRQLTACQAYIDALSKPER